ARGDEAPAYQAKHPPADDDVTNKLPALGEESERTAISDPAHDFEPAPARRDETDPRTVVRPDLLTETGPSRAITGQQTPPLYWILLVIGILLIVAAIIWAVM